MTLRAGEELFRISRAVLHANRQYLDATDIHQLNSDAGWVARVWVFMRKQLPAARQRSQSHL